MNIDSARTTTGHEYLDICMRIAEFQERIQISLP